MYFNSKNAVKALLTITFNLIVFLPNLYAQVNVCAGSTSQLSYSGTGGSWSSSSTGVATVNSSGLVTGVSAGSATVSYQTNNTTNTSLFWNFDNSPSQSGSVFTYNPTTTSNSALLSGYYTSTGSSETVNPFSSWGNSVKQTNFGPQYSYIQFVTTATTTSLSSMVFTVWHNHNNGQAGTGSYDVRLQISSFNGSTWSAWSNIGNSFTWSSNATAQPSPNTGHNISLTGNSVPAGTHRIRWTKISGSASTNGDGYIMNTVTFNCQSVASSTAYSTIVNVSGLATAPTSISGANTICSGSSVTLTANGGTGSLYEWGTGGTIGNNVIGGATSSTYSPSPTATTTYWVRRKQTSPCTGNTGGVTFTVTVNTPSSQPTSISSSASVVCPGNTVVLTANGGTGSVYQWGTGTVGSNIISGATGVSYTAAPTSTTTYWVRRVLQSPCSGTTNATSVTISVVNNTPIQFPTLANGDYVWTGIIDQDWSTDANWSVYNATNGTFSVATNDPDLSTLNVFIPSINSCNSAGISTIRNTRLDRDRTVHTITILADGQLTVDGSDDLDVFGDWINNGTFDHNNQFAVVDFRDPASLQTIGGSSVTEFYNLEISENNANNVVLTANIRVNQDFKFDDNRKFQLNNFNITFLGTASITDENNLRYFVTNGIGVVNRNLTSATFREFPVGITTYNPCFLNNTGTNDMFSVRVIENVTNDGTGVGATTAAPVVKRTWMIDELVTGGSVVDMRLYWNGASEEINLFDQASQFVAHHTGIDWENIGATSNSLNPLYIQKDNVASFSPFTIGSLGGSPLPVELTSFNAVCEEAKGVSVTWSTASEHNSSYFDVLKSDDGHNWRSIAIVSSAGNSVNTINYGIEDAEKANGISYYKLMQYDIDGQSKEYGPISSDCNQREEMIVKTYPNPSGEEFYIELVSNDATVSVITIIDAQGKSVYTRTVETEKGSNVYTFEHLTILPGMYYIQISNDLTTPNVVKHSFR